MIDVLSEIYEESRHQLVLTTHSTVFLDYVKPEQIVLLYRDQMEVQGQIIYLIQKKSEINWSICIREKFCLICLKRR